MKIRSGFVSNSSSSSFVVIDDGPLQNFQPNYDGIWDFRSYGTAEFGWGPAEIRDVYSKVNFAFLQAFYMESEKAWEMVIEVIKEHTGAYHVETGFVIEEKEYKSSDGTMKSYKTINYDDSDGYPHIDHQSSAVEGMNEEIFESKEALKQFLFNYNSRIVLDNDNH